jgi:hypothetical protein
VLFTSEVLFVHPPKTAGMAVTRYLIDTLRGEKFITLPAGHERSGEGATILPGTRHETLVQARDFFATRGQAIERFKHVLAVIRNPYEIEVSRFHYLRLGRPWDAGLAQEIAMSGDFVRFVREVPYPRGTPIPIEDYYTLDGIIPPNLRLLRQERLEADLRGLFGPGRLEAWLRLKLNRPRPRLEVLNDSQHADWREYISAEVEPFIYERYRWLFKFYGRYDPNGSAPVASRPGGGR